MASIPPAARSSAEPIPLSRLPLQQPATPRPQRPPRPRPATAPAGFLTPGGTTRLHYRILQREDRPSPRRQRHRHRAAQPEPRLEHVPARHDRVRQLRRQRAAGLDLVQHAGRCHRHARRVRRHRREPEPEHRPAHGHVHVARPDDARYARRTRSSASCRPTRIRPTAKATSTTRSSPRRASPPARRSTPRRASSSTPTPPSPRRRSSTPSTPPRRRAPSPRSPSTTTTPSFTVSWSGSDGAGSGIADYNVYVSDDGGAFTLLQSDTTATSATLHRPGRPHLRASTASRPATSA